MKKIPVAILGATGAVGQQIVVRLGKHPLFEIAHLGASRSSEGKKYCDAVNWMLPQHMPPSLGQMVVRSCDPLDHVSWTFSALSESAARKWEIAHRNSGKIVLSASSAHRMLKEVPLVAAQVNPEHLCLIARQLKRHCGAIIAKPNCVVSGLALTLRAIQERFGLKKVMCHAMQSVSGGGFNGVKALEVLDNILPLPEEEEKIERETLKVLGSVRNEGVELSEFAISARCMRVAVTEGHLLAVEIATEREASKEQLMGAWSNWNDRMQSDLSSQPHQAIEVIDHPLFPQPRFNRFAGSGMTTVVGSLKKSGVLNWKYLSLTHNTIQGAAGGLILLAEYLNKKRQLELRVL